MTARTPLYPTIGYSPATPSLSLWRRLSHSLSLQPIFQPNHTSFSMAALASKKQRAPEPSVGVDCRLKVRCSSILKGLMEHRHGRFFNKPVDPVALKIPNYFDVICRPMDLGTVKAKLNRDVYSSADAFAADVRLTFSNAIRYYPLGNYVHAVAKELRGNFEAKWKKVMDRNSKVCDRRRLPVCEGLSKKSMIEKPAKRSKVPEAKGVSRSISNSTHFSTAVDHAIQHSCASVSEPTAKLSSAKALRVEMPKCRSADTILEANQKTAGVQTQRLSQKDKLRESARDNILKIEKSIEIEDHLQDLKELESLCGNGDTSLQVCLGLPLKKLGLCLKTDDLDEEAFLNGDMEEHKIRT